MYSVIYLSIRDIFKNFKLYLFINLWIFIFSLLLFSIGNSIFQSRNDAIHYDYYYTQKVDVKKVIATFEKTNYTSYIAGDDEKNAYIVFGDFQFSQQAIVKVDEQAYVKEKYLIEHLLVDRFEILPDELQGADYVLKYSDQLNTNVDLVQFFSHLNIEINALKKIAPLLETIGIKIVFFQDNNQFIFEYVTYIILSLGINMLLSITLMNTYVFSKRIDEYKVHLINGATMPLLFLRNILYFIPMFLIQIGFMYLVVKQWMLLLVVVMFSGVILLAMISTLYFMSSSKKLKVSKR